MQQSKSLFLIVNYFFGALILFSSEHTDARHSVAGNLLSIPDQQVHLWLNYNDSKGQVMYTLHTCANSQKDIVVPFV